MIYWPLPPAPVRWDFPNSFQLTEEDVPGGLVLELRNDVGLWTIDAAPERLAFTPGHIRFTPVVPEDFPAEGEYTYTLKDGDGVVLSTGLLIVGDYTHEREHYEKPIQYEQYD